jgi:uncharacterized membrane protein
LRSGVILATLVVAIGGVIYLIRHGGESADYRKFQGVQPELRTIPGIIELIWAGRSRGIIQFGVLLLIATPVARVAFSVLAFAIQRDRIYVVVTLVVLGILIFSLFAG